MTGEVLTHRRHAGALHAGHEGTSEIGDHLGVVVESAVPDDLVEAAINVQHRREAQVDAHCAKLGGHQPAPLVRDKSGAAGLCAVKHAEAGRGGKSGESVAQPLDAPALLVHGNQQVGIAQPVNVQSQRLELLQRGMVAGKQNNTAHQRMPEPFTLF